MPRSKRTPGAQPGNNNARRHGFYSKGVTLAMRNALRRARALDSSGLTEEIRLARARISMLLQLEPDNHDVLRHTLNTLTRMVAVNHNMSPAEEREFGGAMQELLAELMPERTL